MRVAVLADIHGNLPALEAVLAEVEREGVDRIVVAGDVAAGPLPREVLDRLARLGAADFVMGNADREVVAAFDGRPVQVAVDAWAAAQLDRSHRDALAAYVPTVTHEVDGLGPVVFCHGTPRSDEELVTRLTPETRLTAILAGVPERVVVGGHTHQRFDRVAGAWRFVNAGSVGMPYEGDPAAFWALLGPGVQLRRTAYDVAAAAAVMRAGGLPDVDEQILRDALLDPVDPEAVARHFEARATG